MTDDALRLVLQGATAILTGGVGVLAWSLKRNAKSNDEKLDRISADLSTLAGTTASHATSLAVGNEKFRQIEGRVGGLEDRERERGCFGTCEQSGDR